MTTKLMSLKTFSIFAVVAALLFTFTTAAQAFTVTGKVVSINDSSKKITIEPNVRDPQLGTGPFTFALTRTDPYDRHTMRMADIRDMSDKSIRLRDIHEGDWVTITYSQEPTGQYVAEGIMVGGSALPHGAVTRELPAQLPAELADQYQSTYPQGRADFGALSISGKVIAIDKAAKTFTLDPSYGRTPDRAALGLRTFALDRNSLVLIGSDRREFSDLTIGDMVTVNYRQESTGKILADHVTILPAYPGAVQRPQASLVPSMTLREPLAGNTFRAETTPFAAMGKVVAIDRDARTITIDSSDFRGQSAYNKAAPGVTTFALDKNVTVMSGKTDLGLHDINVGDTVSVNYHQASDGNIIADSIAINPVLPLPEERG